jgi:hypothetical protein
MLDVAMVLNKAFGDAVSDALETEDCHEPIEQCCAVVAGNSRKHAAASQLCSEIGNHDFGASQLTHAPMIGTA